MDIEDIIFGIFMFFVGLGMFILMVFAGYVGIKNIDKDLDKDNNQKCICEKVEN